MKILVAHNRYRSSSPSGENKVVEAEIELLREHKVEVLPLIEDSDRIPPGVAAAFTAGIGPIYSPSGVRDFEDLLETHRPDLVHLHNVFPLISPWVIKVANRHQVPVVQTVHNYRHSCVIGLHYRDGGVCTECLDRGTALPSVIHGCYQGSRVRSVPMAMSQHIHQTTWREGIDRFIALTPFMTEILTRIGIPRAKVSVRPTWVPDGPHVPLYSSDVLYVGRLDRSKGIFGLINAWKQRQGSKPSHLVIAGSGPAEREVQELVKGDRSIQLRGSVTPDEVRTLMSNAGVICVPSVTFEGFPLVVAEAYSAARPVLTVAGGSAASIVQESGAGWVVPRDVDALSAALSAIDVSVLASKATIARAYYEAHNSPAAAWRSLQRIYREVLDSRRNLECGQGR